MPVIQATKRGPAKGFKSVLTKTEEKPFSSFNLQNEIKKRAEEIYRSRNGGPGNQVSDWLQAEKEVKAKYNLFALS